MQHQLFCLVKSLLLCLTEFLMVWYRYPFDPCFTFRLSGYLQGHGKILKSYNMMMDGMRLKDDQAGELKRCEN